MTLEQVEMKQPLDSVNGAASDAVAEFENQEAKRISARERKNAMTDRDRALLDLIQTDFPLEARP